MERLKTVLSSHIIGQKELIDCLLLGLLCNGHVLIEGRPGLGKTSAVKALVAATTLQFGRISFTPDLLPSDLTGAEIYSPSQESFSFQKGPIFCQLLLADELNRAPPKLQSALLEAMQEGSCTVGTKTYTLPKPFFVIATQNPIEEDGCYPLPKAQLDRFCLCVRPSYPSAQDELAILSRPKTPSIEPFLTKEALADIQSSLDHIFVDEKIKKLIVAYVLATRKEPFVHLPASPRATLDLLRVAKAHALLHKKDFVDPSDVAACAPLVLSHRLVLDFNAPFASAHAFITDLSQRL